MLSNLREETAELHRELENDNLANRIMDHTISITQYITLLMQNFIAYQSAETEINKYLTEAGCEKTTRLAKDLKNLGIENPGINLPFKCSSRAEAIGASYVIEGSVMGGMIIGKELEKCENLKGLKKQHFFSGDRSSIKGWNEFLKAVRLEEFSDADINAAVSKAKETFLLFQKAFSVIPVQS